MIGSCFQGDENHTLMQIQANCYGEMLGRLMEAARQRYLRAMRLVGVETGIGKLAHDLKAFDHRTLQMSHDLIAAYFRFAHDNSGQMPLPFTDESYELSLEIAWRRYFIEEVEKLIELDYVVMWVLYATCYQNTERGYAAETGLYDFLQDHYGEMTVSERRRVNPFYASEHWTDDEDEETEE